MKRNIALMAGGNSGEREVSLRSAIEVEKNIDKNLYNVYKIDLHQREWIYKLNDKKYYIDKNDFSLMIDDKKICFDGAFIIIHGTPGENGLLQGYFEMMNIPFASCNVLVSALTFDKVVCNAVIRELGIVKVAPNISFYKNNALTDDEILSNLSLPLFIKPSESGSSVGMTKVKERKDLKQAIETAFEVHERVIIEEYIKGRELTCGVLDTRGEVIAFPVTEVISKKEFFDYEAKYQGLSEEITPAQINETLKEKLQKKAIDIYKNLNCKGVCRVDFIYNEEEDKLYFLEINTIPGQSEQSIVPQQVRAMGWTTKELYSRILEEIF